MKIQARYKRGKGNRVRLARLGPAVAKYLRDYLRRRPPNPATGRLWLNAQGQPLAYWGVQAVFRRLKRRTGLKRIHPHLLRHTFAQTALAKGAERSVVQDMLGHQSDAMTRRYAGDVRKQIAAEQMPHYAPL